MRERFSRRVKKMVTVLESNPFLRPLAEKKKAEAIENNKNFIQWFVDRKVGGAEYENYMKQANETKNENIKPLSL